MFLTQALLYCSKYNNIKPLENVCSVCWIAEHQDLMHAGIFKEPMGIIGVMSINEKQSITPICFCFGMFIKLFDPLNADLIIGPSLFRVPDSMIWVSCIL